MTLADETDTSAVPVPARASRRFAVLPTHALLDNGAADCPESPGDENVHA
jgi:hypothetical protein